MSSYTKTDAKGRLSLGKKFADRHVLIEEVDEYEVRIRTARVVPERKAWLLENDAARASVLKGIEQARAGQFVDSGPDLETDLTLCDQFEGDR